MIKFILSSTVVLITALSSSAYANSIDALERERAHTVNLILDKTISITERKSRLEKSKMKLLDLERMIINNKNINKNPSYQTIKAFENFELTFLVHSSVEKGKPLAITWFEKIGLTTDNLINTEVTRK
tara:strand:- start:373 stop:756 length:384 start_codon:yes stop_codon:yes gene_type:complete